MQATMSFSASFASATARRERIGGVRAIQAASVAVGAAVRR
jgi:hypothetical protein